MASATATTTAGALRSVRHPQRRVDLFPYLLCAPTVLLILGLTVFPAVYAFVMSLYKVQFIELGQFVGSSNYANVLTDPLTATNLLVTVKFVGGSIVGFLITAFVLAMILNQRVAGRALFRTAVLIPWVTTQVVSTLVIKWMVDFDFGFIDQALRGIGLQPIRFLSDSNNAMLTLIGITVWRAAPYGMILLLAGLQTIPGELYEAARVDGAGAWQRFTRITLPLIRSTVLIMLVMESMGLVSLVTPILVLTGGGPADATGVISLRLFKEAFTNFNMGVGATVAMIIFAVDILLSALYIVLLREREA
ncbi:MAG: carbohydrate ABC transporter permease [Chloroflexota bacterium]